MVNLFLLLKYCGLNCISQKDTWKLQPQVPVNGTFFGDRVSGDGTKLRKGHAELQWARNPMTSNLIRRGITRDITIQTHREEGHIKEKKKQLE